MNPKFLENTLLLLEDQVNDLENWSVYNGDRGLDQILEIKAKIQQFRKDRDAEQQAESCMYGETL